MRTQLIMVFPAASLNYTAILVATVVSFLIGGLWYMFLFRKPWMKEMGIPANAKSKGMGGQMFLNIVGTFVMVYVLAHFVFYLSLGTFSEGMQLGFWIWLGFFAATTLLGSVLWEMRSWKLFLINGAYWLVNLAVSAGILAVWK